jgi:hypothetical protein
MRSLITRFQYDPETDSALTHRYRALRQTTVIRYKCFKCRSRTSTWALLIGFAAIGFMTYRRRKGMALASLIKLKICAGR